MVTNLALHGGGIGVYLAPRRKRQPHEVQWLTFRISGLAAALDREPEQHIAIGLDGYIERNPNPNNPLNGRGITLGNAWGGIGVAPEDFTYAINPAQRFESIDFRRSAFHWVTIHVSQLVVAVDVRDVRQRLIASTSTWLEDQFPDSGRSDIWVGSTFLEPDTRYFVWDLSDGFFC